MSKLSVGATVTVVYLALGTLTSAWMFQADRARAGATHPVAYVAVGAIWPLSVLALAYTIDEAPPQRAPRPIYGPPKTLPWHGYG